MADSVRVKPAQLRAIADDLEAHAAGLERSVEATAQRINQLLQGAGFVGQLAAALGTRYRQTQNSMEAWPGLFRQFASFLRDAADRFQTADQTAGGSVAGASTTADFTMSYVSAANRPIYDRLIGQQQALQEATRALNALRTERAAEVERLQDLQAKMIDYEGIEGENVLDLLGDAWEWLATRLDGRYVSTQNLIAALQEHIAGLDTAISQGRTQVSQLTADVSGLQGRLAMVAPGPEADLNAIQQLEQSGGTPDWLKSYTGGCVRHILDRMPIPPEIARNAHLWDDQARANPQYGIQIGSMPLEGSVIVMEGAHSYSKYKDLGHVMYVDHIDQGDVYVTDNDYATPVRLADLTSETSGANISYLYFPWHTKI